MLAVLLHGAAHGGQVGFGLQDRGSALSLPGSEPLEALHFVAFEPGVDDNFAAANLSCDLFGGKPLCLRTTSFEKDDLAALSKGAGRAVRKAPFEGRPLLLAQFDNLDLCHISSTAWFNLILNNYFSLPVW